MIKKLLKSVREYKWKALITPLFVTLEVIMEVLIPYLMAQLIDKGIYANNLPTIYRIGIQLVGATVLSLIFGVLSGISAPSASNGFAKNLRHDLYEKVQKLSFGNIDKFSPASIITRLTTDVTNVKQSFQMITRITVRVPLMIVFSLIMAFNINAKLSLIFVFLVPFMGLGLYFIIKNVQPIFKSVFKKYDKLNNVVEENVNGIRVVKSFVLEEREKKKFKDVTQDIFNNFSKGEKIMALSSPLMQFAMHGTILLISWFGARIIVLSHATALTTGELTSLITYSMQILSSLMMFSMVLVMLTMSKASAERIVELLDEEPDLANAKKSIKDIKNGEIEFKNVGFSYVQQKNKECLKNINLKINSGETVGIIGGTGSGKSTLVNLIPRLYDTVEGTVKVGEIDVKKYDLESLRDAVSIVLQKNVLFSGTIKENLRWGNKNATDDEIIKACKLAQANEFIEKMPNRYDTYIEEGGVNVSGGQKQRLCIARALLKKPKILILDDSTSAVDTKTDSLIRKAFDEEIGDATKIIIAQRVASVENADKIVVMDNGEIVAVGKHSDLLNTCPIYKEVYESQTTNNNMK